MKMKKIKAEIVADSINQQGDRITTYLLTFPRFILAELNTHRVFSKNSASSRAIPFEKMVKMVETDPFIPIAWQSKHSGMQGTEYLDGKSEQKLLVNKWLEARNLAVQQSKLLNNSNVTKQLCNRLLEPFMWHTVLLTGTEFENFFELRCPRYEYKGETFKSKKDCINSYTHGLGKGFEEDRNHLNSLADLDWLQINSSQAEIHMQALAEAMWDAMNESTPKKLQAGEWHIPFKDSINDGKAAQAQSPNTALGLAGLTLNDVRIKISTARCARLSYMTFDNEIDYGKDIKLHDALLESQHASPFEHCCRVLTEEEYNILGKMVLHPENGYVFENGWVDNFKGFISYRRILNI